METKMSETTKEISALIAEQIEIFTTENAIFVEKGTKTAAARARKAIGEIKKLATPYRQASVAECK